MRCGVFPNYPVKVVTVDDDGFSGPEVVIGTAETLGEAIRLAERQGFIICDPSDGGQSRFFLDHSEGRKYFIVTVYPD